MIYFLLEASTMGPAGSYHRDNTTKLHLAPLLLSLNTVCVCVCAWLMWLPDPIHPRALSSVTAFPICDRSSCTVLDVDSKSKLTTGRNARPAYSLVFRGCPKSPYVPGRSSKPPKGVDMLTRVGRHKNASCSSATAHHFAACISISA